MIISYVRNNIANAAATFYLTSWITCQTASASSTVLATCPVVCASEAVCFSAVYSSWYWVCTDQMSGPGSSVGIATDYRLDGPGSNPSGDDIFCLSRPALGPTQPPVKWVRGLSPGVKCSRGVLLTTHPLLVPRSWKSRAISLPTLWATPGL